MSKLIFLLSAGLLGQTPPATVDAVLFWNDAAVELQEKGRFGEALQAYKRAIEVAENSPVTPATKLRLRMNLASLYLEQGDYGSASHLIRAAENEAQDIASDSSELAGLYNAAGTLHLIDGKLSAAQKRYEKALAILDRPGLAPGNELASVLLNIASVQMRQGHYREARHNLGRTVVLLGEVTPTPRSQLIRALATRSTLEYLAKDWTAAERVGAQSLAMAEAHYGPESPVVGEVLLNYSLVLDRLRRGKEARSYRARARGLIVDGRSAFGPLIDITELGFSDRPAVRIK